MQKWHQIDKIEQSSHKVVSKFFVIAWKWDVTEMWHNVNCPELSLFKEHAHVQQEQMNVLQSQEG